MTANLVGRSDVKLINTETQVVKATVGYAAEIVSVLTDATKYKLQRGDFAWGSRGPSEQEVLEQINRDEMYVVLSDCDVVGTFRLQWDDEHYWGKQPPVAAYMHGLAVKESAHGKAVGANVLTWTVQEAARQGRQYLRLDCDEKNFALCRYYERRGFIQVGERALQSGYVAALYQCETGLKNESTAA
jgi:ribosomal protein S18 acetylase RimI-like enzyme